jgi:hypothetical protein
MFELRDTDPVALHEAVKRTLSSLQQTIQFLRTEFKILSSDYVPYETQVLVLAKYFNTEMRTQAADLTVRHWYITSGFNEELRGKADVYVSALLRDDVLEKRFIKGKALSAAFACLFAAAGSKSLMSGSIIEPEDYMQEFDAINYPGLLSLAQIQSCITTTTSNKLLANIILSPAPEAKHLGKSNTKQVLAKAKTQLGERYNAVLKSQFISKDAFKAYQSEDFASFLDLRAQSLADAIRKFCETGSPY